MPNSTNTTGPKQGDPAVWESHVSAVMIFEVAGHRVYGDAHNKHGMIFDLYSGSPNYPLRRFLCWAVQGETGYWGLTLALDRSEPPAPVDPDDYKYPTAEEAAQAVPLLFPSVWKDAYSEAPIFTVKGRKIYGVEHNAHGLYLDLYSTPPPNPYHHGKLGDEGFICWLIYNDRHWEPGWRLKMEEDHGAGDPYPYQTLEDALDAIPSKCPEMWGTLTNSYVFEVEGFLLYGVRHNDPTYTDDVLGYFEIYTTPPPNTRYDNRGQKTKGYLCSILTEENPCDPDKPQWQLTNGAGDEDPEDFPYRDLQSALEDIPQVFPLLWTVAFF